MKNIYVASPMDFIKGNKSNKTIKTIKETLKNHKVYIPSEKWDGDSTDISIKHKINWDFLKKSDIFICLLTGETIGCLVELGYAIKNNTKVLIVVGDKRYYKSTTINNLHFNNVKIVDIDILDQKILNNFVNEKSEKPFFGFYKMTPEAKLPEKAYNTDVGFDIFSLEDTVILKGEAKLLKTGIIVNIPDGYWVQITGRSSSFWKRRLFVVDGVIDQEYRGELKIGVFNTNNETAVINAGDRLAQIIIWKKEDINYAEVDHVDKTSRGSNGFGSSGLNEMKRG